MKNAIQSLVLATLDSSLSKEIKPLQAGTLLVDKKLLLASKREVNFKDLVRNGPLLLTFIRGTWCPFCRMHLNKLREWVSKLDGRNATIIVISSESPLDINIWLDKNPVPYIFASDQDYELADYFGVRLPNKDFFQAATFLIDGDLSLTLAYNGKRTRKLYASLEKKLDSLKNNPSS